MLKWLEIEHRVMQLIRNNHRQNQVFFIGIDVALKQEAVLKKHDRIAAQGILNTNFGRLCAICLIVINNCCRLKPLSRL